jgi:hypothetical protein
VRVCQQENFAIQNPQAAAAMMAATDPWALLEKAERS